MPSKQQKAADELKRRRLLEKYRYYKIPSYFEKISKSEAHTKLLPCPNKVGKSTYCIFETFWGATNTHPYKQFNVPNTSWLVGPTLAHVNEVLIQGFIFWGLDKFWDHYAKKDGIIYWKNGSKTYVKSYDKRENLQGRVIKRIVMDEECDQSIWYEIMMRFAADDPMDILIAATPVNCEEWFADLCDRAENDEKGLEVTKEISIFDALKKNKGHLSEHDVKRIEQLCVDDTERQIRMYGKRIKRGGQFLPLVERVHRIPLHRLPEARINPSWLKIIGIDPHPRKPTSVVWIAIDTEGDAYVYDHMKVSGTTKQQAEQILERCKGQTIFAMYIDPAAKEAMSSNMAQVNWNYYDEFCMLCPKIPVILSVKQPDFVTDAVRYRLAYNHDQPLGPTNKPHLYIMDHLEDLWRSLKSVRWQEYKDRTMLGAKEQLKKGKEDDLMALGYALVKHPIYITLSVGMETDERELPLEETYKEMGY